MHVFGQKWLYSGRVVVIGQNGYIRARLVVCRPKWLYSGKKFLYSTKVVVFGMSGCIRPEVVVCG